MKSLNNYHKENPPSDAIKTHLARQKEGHFLTISSYNNTIKIIRDRKKRDPKARSFIVLDVNGSEGINSGHLSKLGLLPRSDGFRLVWPRNVSAIAEIAEMNALVEKSNGDNSSLFYQTFYASSFFQNPDNSHYRSYNPKQGIHIASFLGTFLILILCFILYKENKFRWCRRKRCSLTSRRDSYEKVLSARLLKRKPNSSMTTASGVMRAGLGAAACVLLPGRSVDNRSNLFDKSRENDNIFKIVYGMGPYVSKPIQTGPFEIANVTSGLYNIAPPINYDSSPQPDSAYYPGHNSLRSESEVESAVSTGYYEQQAKDVLPHRLVEDGRVSSSKNFTKKKFRVPSFLIHHSRNLSKSLTSPSAKSLKDNFLGREESFYSYSSSNKTPSPNVEPNQFDKQSTKFFYPEVHNVPQVSVPIDNIIGQVNCGASSIERWLMYTHNKMFRRSFSAIENRRVAYPKPIPKLSLHPCDRNSESVSIVDHVSLLNNKLQTGSFKSSGHQNGNLTQVKQDQSLQLRRKINHKRRHTICAKSETDGVFCSNKCFSALKSPITSSLPSSHLTNNPDHVLVPQNYIAVNRANFVSVNHIIPILIAGDKQYERKHTLYSWSHPFSKPNISEPKFKELDNYSIYQTSPMGNKIKEKIVNYLFGPNTIPNTVVNGHSETIHITSPNTNFNDSKDILGNVLTYSKNFSYTQSVEVPLINLRSK